jgi:hypothetical protein
MNSDCQTRIVILPRSFLPGLAIISYVIGDEASGHCAAGPAITDSHRGLLQDRLGEVLRDRVVAVVCDGSGYRGGIAASFRSAQARHGDQRDRRHDRPDQRWPPRLPPAHHHRTRENRYGLVARDGKLDRR